MDRLDDFDGVTLDEVYILGLEDESNLSIVIFNFLSSGTIYFQTGNINFVPAKLDRSFDLTSKGRNFEEINIAVDENIKLNAIYRNQIQVN